MANSIYDLGNKSIQPGFQSLDLPQFENNNTLSENIMREKYIFDKFSTPIKMQKIALPTDKYLKSNPIKPLTVKKEPWTKSIENNQIEVDALNEVDKELTTTSFKAPSIIGLANIATGVSSLINAGVSLKGAMDAGKMQPSLMKPFVPIEAKTVADNTSAIQTAGQENIDKSINTNRADLTRKGIVGMEGVLIGKETEALNQLGGQLAQYRTGIDTANAQIENSVNAQNKQAEMQTEQFNAQTQNQFDQYKSGLIGMGMKNATDAITSGAGSIFGNMMAGKEMKIGNLKSQLAQVNKLFELGKATGNDVDLRDKLQKEIDKETNLLV